MKKLTPAQESMIKAAARPFVPREERKGRITRETLCRGCCTWTDYNHETERWEHRDGTDACLDPNTMAPYEEELLPVAVPERVHDEYVSREVGLGESAYDKVRSLGGRGTVMVTMSELESLLSDASYYCEPDGPGEFLDDATKKRYRVFKKNLMTAKLATNRGENR